MKKSFFKQLAKVLFFSILLTAYVPLFAEDKDTTPLPYEEDEFPTALKDLRRFEIISLGALPFVTLDTTIVYSGIRYASNDFNSAYTPDIFSKSSYTPEEQAGIILTSVGISVGIGLTDYIVQLIKRSSKAKKKQITYDDISITPISQDADAIKIELEKKE